MSVRFQVSFTPMRFRYIVDLLRESRVMPPLPWFLRKRIEIIFHGRCRPRKLKSAKNNRHVFETKPRKFGDVKISHYTVFSNWQTHGTYFSNAWAADLYNSCCSNSRPYMLYAAQFLLTRSEKNQWDYRKKKQKIRTLKKIAVISLIVERGGFISLSKMQMEWQTV